MIKVAITGNIATGKSEVERIVQKQGYDVFDSDTIAHELLDELTDFYGYEVFTNNKIDRKKLGDLVFSDIEAKQKLENIIHPKVKERIFEIFGKNQNKKIVFISVPLLFEAHFDNIFDKIILVTTDDDTQLKRLMKRNNLTQEDAVKRINSQLPQIDKIKKADFVINNNSDIKDLENQTLELLAKLNNL